MPGPAGPRGPAGPAGARGPAGATGAAAAANRGSLVPNGWYQDAGNGFLIQWGRHTLASSASSGSQEAINNVVAFPVSFLSACFIVVGCAYFPGVTAWSWRLDQGVLIGSFTKTNFSYNRQYFSATVNASTNWGVAWIAVGK